ncbi:hypothetical protein EON65_16830 [archaeon]|nr:MAG: hypothetical protein EON65_16830 [archaeon]
MFQRLKPKNLREEIGTWSEWKKHVVACMGEFVGTFLFLWIALAGTSFANMPQTSASGNSNVTNASNVLYSALAFGFSLTVNAWIFFRVSGGLFNPAITFGLALTGIVPWFRGLLLVITQFFAAIVASYVVKVMFSSPFSAETLLRNGTTVVQGVFIEALMTFQLLLAIFMLAAEKSKVCMY